MSALGPLRHLVRRSGPVAIGSKANIERTTENGRSWPTASLRLLKLMQCERHIWSPDVEDTIIDVIDEPVLADTERLASEKARIL